VTTVHSNRLITFCTFPQTWYDCQLTRIVLPTMLCRSQLLRTSKLPHHTQTSSPHFSKLDKVVIHWHNRDSTLEKGAFTEQHFHYCSLQMSPPVFDVTKQHTSESRIKFRPGASTYRRFSTTSSFTVKGVVNLRSTLKYKYKSSKKLHLCKN
jgi:hypothetical protein